MAKKKSAADSKSMERFPSPCFDANQAFSLTWVTANQRLQDFERTFPLLRNRLLGQGRFSLSNIEDISSAWLWQWMFCLFSNCHNTIYTSEDFGSLLQAVRRFEKCTETRPSLCSHIIFYEFNQVFTLDPAMRRVEFKSPQFKDFMVRCICDTELLDLASRLLGTKKPSKADSKLIGNVGYYADSDAKVSANACTGVNFRNYRNDVVKGIHHFIESHSAQRQASIPINMRSIPFKDLLDAATNWFITAYPIKLTSSPMTSSAKQLPEAGTPKTKRSSSKGSASDKLIAALTKHHKYADRGCLKTEPIGCNELARLAEVSKASSTRFFQEWFLGHSKYSGICRRNTSKLVDTIKCMQAEFLELTLVLGRTPEQKGD